MLNGDTLIIDADSHWTEPHDLFTSVAPAEYKDRVPRVETVEGQPTWVFDGHVMGQATAAGVIGRDGKKESADLALNHWTIDMIHVGAYDPKVRLQVLDECGIDAQVIFPSTIGLGGQDLGAVEDQALCRLVIEIYNDRMAEIQADSNNRLLPMPLMPAWDVDTCVAEAEAGRRARGAWCEHDVGPAGPRCARSRQPRVGPVLGDVHRARAPGALPHRRQHHRHVVLQQLPLGLAPHEHPARDRRHLAVRRQRACRHEHDPVGHVRPPSRPEDGVRGERCRMDPVHPRDARLRDGRERSRRARAAEEDAVGVLPDRTSTRRSGSRTTATSSRSSSTLSARTTSCSRPTSRTQRVSIRIRSRQSRRRWPRWHPRCARRSTARTLASCIASEHSPGVRAPHRPHVRPRLHTSMRGVVDHRLRRGVPCACRPGRVIETRGASAWPRKSWVRSTT